MSEEKWTVQHGIHRGTLTSRDSSVDTFDSEESAREYFQQQKAFYRKIGYSIWFAYLISPDGHETVLDAGTPYW